MSNPVIVREWGDGSNGVLIALIIAVVVGLAIRAFSTWRMNMWNNDAKTVDVKVEAPNLPTAEDMPTTEDMPSVSDVEPSAN